MVEWLTAAVFLMTGLVGYVRFMPSPRTDLILLIVTFLGFLGFLDELSFGERVFDLEFPRILGTKLDSAYDLIFIAKHMIEDVTHSPYILSPVLALGLAMVLYGGARLLIARGWRIHLGAEAALIAGAIGLLAVAQAVDINLREVPHEVLKRLYVEEIFELGAGFLLCAFVTLRSRLDAAALSRTAAKRVDQDHPGKPDDRTPRMNKMR